MADYAGVLESGRDWSCPSCAPILILVVDVGENITLLQALSARLTRRSVGEVFWAGKPHPSAYETAHTKAQAIRQADVPKSRILAIGDAIRTDLKSAEVRASTRSL